MTPPTELQKKEILSQILSSPEFTSSKRYQELLQYLVDKSSKVSSLKETELAHDILGADSTFDPSSDSVVRAHVSNLRKKLEHYYLTTSHSFDYRIDIPKGQYLIKYLPVGQRVRPEKTNRYPKYVYLFIILALVAVVIIQLFTNRSASTPGNGPLAVHPIWSSLVKQDSPPLLIVLGDFLVLSEKDPSRRSFLRSPQINSQKDYDDSLKANPGKFGTLEISDVTFIGAGPALGIVRLMQALSGSMGNVAVKLSHDLKWDDLDYHNIIYLGTFKSLYKLDTLFSRTNIKFHLRPYSLRVVGQEKDTIQSFDLTWLGGGGNYQKDYSAIMKLTLEKNRSIVFLTGFSEVGVMDALQSSLDPSLAMRIKNFCGTSMSIPSGNFALISEVEGLRYTVFGSQIKYVHSY